MDTKRELDETKRKLRELQKRQPIGGLNNVTHGRPQQQRRQQEEPDREAKRRRTQDTRDSRSHDGHETVIGTRQAPAQDSPPVGLQPVGSRARKPGDYVEKYLSNDDGAAENEERRSR